LISSPSLSGVPTSDLINDMKGITTNVQEITESLKRVLASKEGEERLVSIMQNVDKTVSEVRRAVVDNGPKVDKVVDNVVAVSREAKGFVREFRSDARAIMADAKTVARDAKVVTADARAISGGVRALVDPGGAKIPGTKVVDGVVVGADGKPKPTVSNAVAKLESALANLDGTLEKTRSIADKIDRGEGSIGKLVNDGRLVDGMTDLVDESSRFVRRLTRLQVLVSMRGEYYVSQGAVKNYLELRLQPRPDKYYAIQIVDDPRGASRFVETVTTSSDSMSDPVVRTQESVTENRFRLSLMFAKSYYFVTGRIGIIESSGGLGLDFNFFDNSLELSADMYDFDANVNPRLRMRATYRFFTHLYVAAGVDDVFNDELSDGFIGAGVQFTDEDMQAILTVAPTPSL
jgi:phospholipid/cholesterol/gamma-HCH transport system substrate-binding protein